MCRISPLPRPTPRTDGASVRISAMEYVVAAVILLVVLVAGAVGLVAPRLRRRELPPPGSPRAAPAGGPPAGPPGRPRPGAPGRGPPGPRASPPRRGAPRR